MNAYTKALFVILLGVILAGCQAGQQVTPPVETQIEEESDLFAFAESSFLIVDSDMMAEQFFTNRLPAAYTTIDSVTAVEAVYQILMDSLLGEESKEFDLATVPQLYRQYLQLRYDQVMQLMYKDLMVDSVTVPDSEIVALYDASKEEFKISDQYRARHIVISGHGLKDSEDSTLYRDYDKDELDSIAYDKIAGLRERVVAGASFDTLAIMYSLDPASAVNGGDLGLFHLSNMVAPFDSTVEHTPVGEISGIIKTIFGWHFLRVEEFIPEYYLPLDSVRMQLEMKIKQGLLVERGRHFIDSLISVGSVVLDSAAVGMDEAEHQPDDPLAFINPADTVYGNDTLYFRDYGEQLYAFRKKRRIDRPLNFEERVYLINSIAVRFHLLRAARTLGYYDHPTVENWAADKIKRYAISTLKKRMMDDDYKPSEEEIRTYYENNIDQYQVERPIYVQHIIFADSNLAEHVRDLLNSGADFLETAQEYYPGDPDIRLAAADLGQIGPGDMPQTFWQAVQRTPVGKISSPVKTEFGYHLIKVIEKKYSVSLEKAGLKIEPLLLKQHRERMRREYVETRLDAPPVIHWERLGDLYRKQLPPPEFPNLP